VEAAERRVKSGGLNRSILLIVAVVVLLRLPFLNQAIQGDDPYYLFGAQHALIDPAHPSHAKYIFQGELVDMRGHPHPPLNAWVLAGLLVMFGDVYEVPFHAAYIVFSAIAAISMYFLAKRFSDFPLPATLLFCAVPAFVVNGNSLESDLPFLAFWMAGFALFVFGRYAWSALALALAAMTAYQAIVATPILGFYCWLHARRSARAWAVTLTPVVIVAVYQVYERLTSGALPATVLAGYFSSYGLQQLSNKAKNALALTVHAGWIVFPVLGGAAFGSRWPYALAAAAGGILIDANPLFWVSFAMGVLAIGWCVRKPDFLTAWVLIFFAAALVLFFAGSARYLLPIAAPLAILAAKQRRYVPIAVAGNLIVGLALAYVNYEHWDGYRRFAHSVQRELHEKRVWINGEWGLRFYLESEGALPIARTQAVQPGEWIVASALALPVPVTAPLATVAERDIRPWLPIRLIGLESKAGYSTASAGFRPFDFGTGTIDRVRIDAVMERRPTLSYLPMNAPEAQNQIASGVYQLEGQWRWMSGRAVVLLKPPDVPQPLHVQIYIPDPAPARTVGVLLDGQELHSQTVPAPGVYTITSKPATGSSVTIVVDKTFSVPGDHRELGAILTEVGFR
jgi:hypothetical protein